MKETNYSKLCSFENLKVFSILAFALGVGSALLLDSRIPMFAFVGILLIATFVWRAERKRAFRAYAQARGFAYSGSNSAHSLWLETTSFSTSNYSISNSILGTIGTTDLAIFDLSIRQGKSTVRQTVVGFRPAEKDLDSITGTIGPYRFELAGQWIIGYIPRRVVETSELDDWCKELYELSLTLTQKNAEPHDPATLALARLYQEF